MKSIRNWRVRTSASPLVQTKGGSKIVQYVFQTLFRYMRLSGLVVPLVCNHNHRVRREMDQDLEDPQTVVQTVDTVAIHSNKTAPQEEREKGSESVSIKTSLSMKTSTGLMETGSELTSDEVCEEILHNICNHADLTTADRKSENENEGMTDQINIYGKLIDVFELSDPENAGRSNKEVSGCEEHIWAQKTKTQGTKQKNNQVLKNSKASVKVNLIITRPNKEPPVPKSQGRCGMKNSEQHNHQDIVHSETEEVSVAAAKTQKRTIYESNPDNMEESREEELTQCHKCQVILFCNRIFCVTVCILLASNCVRYASSFFILSFSTVKLISAITFQSFFIGITVMYILSARIMAKQLPQLLEDLRKFEDTYGVSVDLVSFRRKTLIRSRCLFTLQLLACTGFVLFEQFVFPSLRIHLVPLHNAEGVAFYIALIGFGAVINFIGSFTYFTWGFLGIVTYILILEFRKIISDLQHVLTKPSVVLSLPGWHIQWNQCGSLSENSPSSSTRHRGMFQKRRPLKQYSMKSRKSSSTVVTIEDIDEDVSGFEVTPHNTTDNHRNRDGCNFDDAKKTQYIVHESSEEQRSPGSPFVDNFIQRNNQTVDGIIGNENASSSKGIHENEGVAEQEVAQESSFDILHAKHQMLCELVATANGCIRHFVSITFAGSLPLACLMIYVLISGSLEMADFLYFMHNLLATAFNLVLVICIGFRVSDAAHGAQEVIYAADWSQFSDRLLTKVQLFATRLGHSQIGFDVYGLFVIDRSTVMMVVGTLVTYTVVVIQFQQAETCDCGTGDNTTVPS